MVKSVVSILCEHLPAIRRHYALSLGSRRIVGKTIRFIALLVIVPSLSSGQSTRNAVIHTSEGDIGVLLYASKAPKAVNNFIGLSTGEKAWVDPNNCQLVEGRPLYDGTIFHRVVNGFVIQGGDPLGTGVGGPGYRFEDEFSDLSYDQPGRVGMANAGPNSNGCQFFITTIAVPHLSNRYTIFGQVTSGMSVVKAIEGKPVNAQDRPTTPIYINHIDIITESSINEWQLY